MKRSLLLFGLLAAMPAGCASARRGEPLRGPLSLDARGERGRATFQRFCHGCHPGGEGGLGPALNNKPMPGFVVRFQVRHGLGAMPSFSEELLKGDELDDLVHFLGRLKRHRR